MPHFKYRYNILLVIGFLHNSCCLEKYDDSYIQVLFNKKSCTEDGLAGKETRPSEDVQVR